MFLLKQTKNLLNFKSMERKDNAKTNKTGYLQEVGTQWKEGGNRNRATAFCTALILSTVVMFCILKK